MEAPTLTQTGVDSSDDANAPWSLILASSDAPAVVGARSEVRVDQPLLIGRGSSLGGAPLQDPRLSREHAKLHVSEDDRLWIKDLSSRNGTYVNEQPVELQRLRPGDVVGIGALLFLVERNDSVDDAGAHPTLVGLSAEHRCVLGQVRQVSELASPVLILGEVGTGKSSVARAIHEASGRPGKLVEIPCDGIPDAHVQTELFGWVKGGFPGAEGHRVGLLEQAAGGTLLLDSVGAACTVLQDCIASFIERKSVRKIGAASPENLDVRVLATCHASQLARLQPNLRSRLSAWVVELPPLRDRKIDIASLAERFASEATGVPTRFHYRAMARLLRYHWPANAQELMQAVTRAVHEAEDERPIPMTPSVAALGLPAADETDEPAPASASLTQAPDEALVVSFDGGWFRPPNGERVDLSRRHNLKLILKALADRRRDDAGKPMSVADVFRLGWPGVRALEEAGNNRVYVALATLRKLGLSEVLVRNDEGYALTRDVPLLTHWGEDSR